MTVATSIRPIREDETQAVRTVIERAYEEVGDRLDLRGCDRDLVTPARFYADGGGVLAGLECDGRIRGTHAALPLEADRVATFRRLYLDRELRGHGHGAALMQWTIDWAATRGFRRVTLYSDVRFERAHRLFESFGFRRGSIRRATPANPYDEHEFTLELGR